MIKTKWLRLVVVLLSTLSLFACVSNQRKEEEQPQQNAIAYICVSDDSSYTKTFHELNLGTIFDFSLQQNHADESWLELWVEAYQNGQPMDPFQVITLSYGNNPEAKKESNIGFAIMKFDDSVKAILYSSGISSSKSLPDDLLDPSLASAWKTTISTQPVGLKYGDEILLAYYVNSELAMFPADDLQAEDEIQKLIEFHKNVLILKLRIDKEPK